MRSYLTSIGLIVLLIAGVPFFLLAEENNEVKGKIVSSYDEATGSTIFRYEYDLAPEVIKSMYAISDTVVEPLIFVYEDGSVQLFMCATRAGKQKWFFLDSATLLLGLENDKVMRISFGCEKIDEDILYASEYREVMDDARVVEVVMVQLTPTPFGEEELEAVKKAETMQIVLYGKQAPLILKSGTGQWQAFFDPSVWKKMVLKYKDLRKEGK